MPETRFVPVGTVRDRAAHGCARTEPEPLRGPLTVAGLSDVKIATVVRTDVNCKSLVQRHVEEVGSENRREDDSEAGGGLTRVASKVSRIGW